MAKDKAVKHIKEKAKDGLKQHHKQELKIKGNHTQRAGAKTAKQANHTAQRTAKDTVRTAERTAEKTVKSTTIV